MNWRKCFLAFFIILVIAILVFCLYKAFKNSKSVEKFTGTTKSVEKFTGTRMAHATYYANWAQFWPGGPQDNTDNSNVNSPYAIAGALADCDTIIYGIVLFGVLPNPTLTCSLEVAPFSFFYSCNFVGSTSDGIKFILQGCLSEAEGSAEEDAISVIFGPEAADIYDTISNVAGLISDLMEGISDTETPPTYVSDNGAYLTYPMYPNECFTGCDIEFDKFYWSTSGTGSKCCSLHRITDPFCFAQLRSLGKTLIASYGGWTYTHGGAEFSDISYNMFVNMIANSGTRSQFINASGNTLSAWGFQGADFDWEYPGSQSAHAVVTTSLGYLSSTDFYNFECLIREYRQKFPNFILSMQCSGFLSGDAYYPDGPLDGYIQNGETVNMASDSDYFAWINRLFAAGLTRVNFMAYDYYVAGGQNYTMPNTPLYSPNKETNFSICPWKSCSTISSANYNPSYPWINPSLTIANYQNQTTESFDYLNCGTVTAGVTKDKNGNILNSFWGIAQAYGLPMQAVIDATNALQPAGSENVTSNSSLSYGQTVYIPCNNSAVPVCGTGSWPSGYGASQVASNSGVTSDAFNSANPLYAQYANYVNPGNVYNIPCLDTTPENGNACPTWILRQSSYGDVASAIGANVSDVTDINSTSSTALTPNQYINVPCVNNVCPGPYYALPGDSLQSIFNKLFPRLDTTVDPGKTLYSNYLSLNSNLNVKPTDILSSNPQTPVRVPCNSPKSVPAPSVPVGTELDFQGAEGSATVPLCILKSMVLMSQAFGSNIGKVHLGIALYGRSFANVNFMGMTGDDLVQNSVGLPSYGAMPPGSYTQTSGVLSYYEIQQLLAAKDTNGNPVYQTGYNKKYGINVAYSVELGTWISYDGFEAIADKMNFAKCFGFGGVMTFTPQQDDFTKSFPLMGCVNYYR